MHKCLAAVAGGSGHGHGTQAVLGVRRKVIHNWAVFYGSGADVSRCKMTVLFESVESVAGIFVDGNRSRVRTDGKSPGNAA